MIDWNCFIAPSECVEKRLLWYSSQGSIITHPHFSHWTQAIVMGWWIVESWMLWPSLSNSWSTYKIHTRYRTPEYTLWWPDGSWRVSLDVVTNLWHWAAHITLSRYQDKWRSSRTLAAADLRLWSSNNVRLVAGVDHEWEHFSWLHSPPSSPVTARARPVPPSYLVTIIRYNFTTP